MPQQGSKVSGASPLLALSEQAQHEFDVFLLYAHEDREQVARPLAVELQRRGLRVWFDESEIRLGDNIATRIDDGLRSARAAVAIISPAFLARGGGGGGCWPIRELTAFSLERSTSPRC